jgi:hypothetical protein
MSRRADDLPLQGLGRGSVRLEQMTPEQMALLRGDVNGEELNQNQQVAPNPQAASASQVQQARENNQEGGNTPSR